MKIRARFKTPDVLFYAAEDYLGDANFQQWLVDHDWAGPKTGREGSRRLAEQGLEEALSDLVKSGEFITVEFDLEAKTGQVIPWREKA